MALRLPVSVLLLSPLRIAAKSGVWSRAMSIKVGDSLPDVQIFDGGPGNKASIKEVFGNKKGVLFGVPGAFTPGCSKTHLPGFVQMADSLKSRGVEVLACISVNDAFVVSEWGKAHEAEGKVRMLADPCADFAKAAGLLLEKKELEDLFGNKRCKRYKSPILGPTKISRTGIPRHPTGINGTMGCQFWRDAGPTSGTSRFSMIIEGGKLKALNIEEDGTGLTCSLAGNIMSQL